MVDSREAIVWIKTGRNDMVRYRRPNGWDVTNFGTEPYPLDQVDPRHRRRARGIRPGESTVWTFRSEHQGPTCT